MQIIIARYQEDVSWIEKLSKNNSSFFIRLYNKGDLLEKKPGIYVQNLPNTGRETDTFLRHIIDNYSYIFEVNAFLQGNPFYHDEEVLAKLDKPTGSLEALGSILVSDWHGGPHHPGLSVKETYKRIFGREKDTFEFSAGAQWIVPKENIINKSITFWRKLYDIFLDTPHGPWVFERLWQDIFLYKEDNENT